jgi:hypothetical protein
MDPNYGSRRRTQSGSVGIFMCVDNNSVTPCYIVELGFSKPGSYASGNRAGAMQTNAEFDERC